MISYDQITLFVVLLAIMGFALLGGVYFIVYSARVTRESKDVSVRVRRH